ESAPEKARDGAGQRVGRVRGRVQIEESEDERTRCALGGVAQEEALEAPARWAAMVHGELNVARSRARWGGRRRAICVGPRREVAAEQLLVERREPGRAGLESVARLRSTPSS